MTKEKSNPPVAKLQDGLLNIAIWERKTKDGDIFHSITLERRYKTKDGTWTGTSSLNEDDLLTAAELFQQAYREIKRLRGLNMKKPTFTEVA